MSKQLPKNWRIESSDGSRVVRITSAGIILSDSSNEAALFDYQTARSVAEQIQGIMLLEKRIVLLTTKPNEPKRMRHSSVKEQIDEKRRRVNGHQMCEGGAHKPQYCEDGSCYCLRCFQEL